MHGPRCVRQQCAGGQQRHVHATAVKVYLVGLGRPLSSACQLSAPTSAALVVFRMAPAPPTAYPTSLRPPPTCQHGLSFMDRWSCLLRVGVGVAFRVPSSAVGSRVSPPLRPREDGLAHPAQTQRSNLAAALGVLWGCGLLGLARGLTW